MAQSKFPLTNSQKYNKTRFRSSLLLATFIIFTSFINKTGFTAANPSVPLDYSRWIRNSVSSLLRNANQGYLSSSSSPTSYSDLLMNIIKFLVKSVFSKRWTTNLAIKRLDNLKQNLINYYATKVEFEARDKGIGFPSLEGALLSLAFLTFSVYLIDLIQILLAKLKMKKNAQATQAPAAVLLGREYLPIPYASTTELTPSAGSGMQNVPGFNNNAEFLTTLSTKVLSAIEKPTMFTQPSGSSWSSDYMIL